MSAKKDRNLWQTCKLCATTMPYQDVQKHDKDQCATDNVLSGFIQNNVFNSKQLENKVITDDLKKFTTNQLNKFIFMASAAIKACHLKIGDFVEIELTDGQSVTTKFVKQIWPESDIFGAKVFLTKEGEYHVILLPFQIDDTRFFPQRSRAAGSINPTLSS
jgi:hypothetical protein